MPEISYEGQPFVINVGRVRRTENNKTPSLTVAGHVIFRIATIERNTQNQLIEKLAGQVPQNGSTFRVPHYCSKKSALYNSNKLTAIISIKHLWCLVLPAVVMSDASQ